MKINEVCNLTGLTKKAISYYEKQELIMPMKDKNGYRDYANKDIKLLNEISLYRKLDISIKEIKLLLASDDKKSILKNIIIDKQKKEFQIKVQKVFLDKIIKGNFEEEDIKLLNEKIINNEKKSGEFIKNELKRAFPSGLGLYLSYHFSPYLNEPINSEEKYNAWINIVEFLDNLPQLNIKMPEAVQSYYENISEEMHKKIVEGTREEILKMVNAEGEELEKYKKKILDTIENQNDKEIAEAMKPVFKFKKQMNEFFNNSGYYNIFLPNMKVLSNEYKEYHKSLLMLNEKLSKELGIEYDENMRIVKTVK
ncbi:MerR family transcriptional regulator [Clostridium sediminicola]|uniref:MerR family transcriptional regulator n=1 Tax=Clostridium sediminicola TaxID=3114879 RepID=UPI0031F1E94E